ncbi:hypothetical protein [Pseudoalteromonas sp. MMG012]|uniref:hypothetical protein n=1 Tax=Pseudoalteromonas sp. MMG012 TaxID=2822686 RepID=UPI001B39D237|nr:hypothetical protein [Pseudoalteromonas sp. MMG012]MBQ4850270.1 hypothetical protein [Pseudoalteromonas sp. MMG012]
MKLFILASITLLLSVQAFASVKSSSSSTVKTVITYSQHGGGDVVFKISNSEISCADGYWLKKIDPDFEANLSVLLSAYHSKSTVITGGHDVQIWTGSTSKYCLLYSIELI